MDKFICGVATGAMIMGLVLTQVQNYAQAQNALDKNYFESFHTENNITGENNESK